VVDILRVRKDVTLLRESMEMYTLMVGKIITSPRENWMLPHGGDLAILFPLKAEKYQRHYSTVNLKHDNFVFES
jgi:hypothetical protein